MKLSERKLQILLLLGGIVLLGLSQVRCGVGLLAWFAPVPLLVFLRRTSGWRSRLALLGVLCLAWSLAAAKYITPPLPYMLILLNGVSYGVVSFIGYLGWDRLRRGLPTYLSSLTFAALMVVLEWLQHSFTPLASNGAAAYTQLENLAFLQTVSLFGIGGPSLLMYWFAAVVAEGIVERRIAWRVGSVVVGLIVLAHVWGAIRIGSPSRGETVEVAAVSTDLTWFGGPLPDQAELRAVDDALFERTVEAAAAGARMIVWNEVSTFVDAEDEAAVIERAGEIAREHRIHLVMSHIVPVSSEPLQVENKYIWIGPGGDVVDTYLKHKPVPGEPSIAGDGRARVVETGFGKATGAICFDFDYPQVGLDRARRGADIVFLPSSDTAGVDPFHTQIAAVRAIEGGFSVIRSTRMGLSAGIDPVGRIRGWLSANETDQRILLVTVPTNSIWTLYSVIGDALAYAALAFLVFVIVVRIRNRAR
jgi:apolipoprotein N-acyltransferase